LWQEEMAEIRLKIGKAFGGIIDGVYRLIKYINSHKYLARSISIGFIVFLLFYLYFSLKDDTQLIINSFSGFKVSNFVYSYLIYGINFFIFFEIWRVILRGFGFSFSKVDTLKIFASTYLAKFIPSPIFLYASRITQLQKIGMSPKRSIAVTALEFIFQVTVGIILYGIVNVKLNQPITWLWILAIIFCVGLLLSPHTFSNKFLKEEKNFNFDRKRVFGILILEFVPWLLGGLFFFFIYRNFVTSLISIEFIDLLGIWIIANVTSLIGSYLLGGLGLLREFTLVLLLHEYFPTPIAITVSATVRVMLIVCGVTWAIFWYLISLLIQKIGNRYQNTN
jgi:hypothetical protein